MSWSNNHRKKLKDWPWWELHWDPRVERNCGETRYHGVHTWVLLHQEPPYKDFKRGVVVFLCNSQKRNYGS